MRVFLRCSVGYSVFYWHGFRRRLLALHVIASYGQFYHGESGVFPCHSARVDVSTALSLQPPVGLAGRPNSIRNRLWTQ